MTTRLITPLGKSIAACMASAGFAFPTVAGIASMKAPSAKAASPTSASAKPSEIRLVDFTPKERRWVSVNDGVMGGVSSGSLAVKNGVATFSGRVRLENNGGFASIRSSANLPQLPEDSKSFSFRVRGDGSAYQFTVDTDAGWFWALVQPAKNKWSTMTVAFDDLVPVTRFGEPAERDAFDASQPISAVGFLISNRKAEKFTLSIDWIAVNSE